MAELLDANWFRACSFALAAVVIAGLWRHEAAKLARSAGHDDRADRDILWPLFWLLIAGIYAMMAVALGSDLAGVVGGAGRDYARSDGWYEARRPLQAVVVGVVTAVWATTIVVGLWRVPERRRRYLPSALLCTTLVCFAIVRTVSFHYVDTIVVRTSIAGVPVGTVVEMIGLVVAAALGVSAARRPIPTGRVDRVITFGERPPRIDQPSS